MSKANPQTTPGAPQGLAGAQRNTLAGQGSVLAELEAEWKRDLGAKAARKSTLDQAVLRTRRSQLRHLLEAGAQGLEAGAPPYLAQFLAGYDQTFEALEQAITEHETSIPGQRRYSQATRDLARETYEAVATFRKRVGDRLGHQEAAADLLSLCGIGFALSAEAPQDVLAVATKQLAATSGPEHVAALLAAGLFPERQHARLAPLVSRLQKSIHDGVGADKTRGEATAQVEAALLKLEILLSRAVAFIEEFGKPQAAKALEDGIPKRHQSASGKKGKGKGKGKGDSESSGKDSGSSGKDSESSGDGPESPSKG